LQGTCPITLPVFFFYNQSCVYIIDIWVIVIQDTKIQSSWIIANKWNKRKGLKYYLILIDNFCRSKIMFVCYMIIIFLFSNEFDILIVKIPVIFITTTKRKQTRVAVMINKKGTESLHCTTINGLSLYLVIFRYPLLLIYWCGYLYVYCDGSRRSEPEMSYWIILL